MAKKAKEWVISREFYQDNEDSYWTRFVRPERDESISSWFTRITKENCAQTEHSFHDIMNKKIKFEFLETNNQIRQAFYKNVEQYVKLRRHRGSFEHVHVPL